MDGVAGIENNNGWGYAINAWPTLSYQLNDKVTLGAAYKTESFLKSDASGFTEKGLTKGLFQAMAAMTF